MSIVTGNVVAETTATVLYVNRTGAFHNVTFTTHGNSADVYIGGLSVTSSSNGAVIPKSFTFQMVIPGFETLYCAGNGTDTVKFVSYV